jgi:hypothetical protein
MLASVHSADLRQNELPACLGGENPHRLVSLWDMVRILASEVVSLYPALVELHLGFGMGGKDAPSPQEIEQTLSKVIVFCGRLKWIDLKRQAERLLSRTIEGQSGEVMEALCIDLRKAFEQKLEGLHALLIDQGDADLFVDAVKSLCGGPLDSALAISEGELNSAGQALAVGLPTAAVSHAMRSVEASLHALCGSLAITFPGTIELQDWKTLTEKISSEIKNQEDAPRSPLKTERLKQLAELMVPADGFRLAWRNHVAHARERYEDDPARKVLGYVGEFLARLSAAV